MNELNNNGLYPLPTRAYAIAVGGNCGPPGFCSCWMVAKINPKMSRCTQNHSRLPGYSIRLLP
ncbi:unnamed protein product [Penicillium roqueforti FM164]|uniref:Genomic scaffold, ProqFM164S02 n=1 Tax=Penicillium roqueforti (strain FM164) TaxID=1365484 RepID=W6Q8B4_PENRF|nr:unnamed protein product [Penicillium roqueforti FM164]